MPEPSDSGVQVLFAVKRRKMGQKIVKNFFLPAENDCIIITKWVYCNLI